MQSTPVLATSHGHGFFTRTGELTTLEYFYIKQIRDDTPIDYV